MHKPEYAVGGTIVLKASMFRVSRAGHGGRVVAVLPDSQRMAEYRVRFENEACGRHITEADIDHEASSPTGNEDGPITARPAGAWNNPNAVRIHR